ncbi:MAG: hypothetical protein KF861_13245 [Planctomycetaceae bacterium]|nr:hypothetical protein [Planctomycetaceae bacterium]
MHEFSKSGVPIVRNPLARAVCLLILSIVCSSASAADLTRAVVVVRPGELPLAEQTAARVLVEEVARRMGLNWTIATKWPQDDVAVIAVTAAASVPEWGHTAPGRTDEDRSKERPEGYRVVTTQEDGRSPVVWILGADPRGALFGVGDFLRNLDWRTGQASFPDGYNVSTAPVYPIRGHQIGYRARANSWDAWTEEQFDQFFRELAIFGTNSIENIPFQDETTNPLMKYSRREMNRKMSEICDRYDMDYWVWTPAEFDLKDQKLRADMLSQHETLYQDCPRMNGVFFPGGDPGDNSGEDVMPFLAEVGAILIKYHPDARVWVSLQRFRRDDVDAVYEYIDKHDPQWLGGLVGGPSSPPIPALRNRLPERYGFRDYPDITHNKLCQFIVPWWDPAYAVTLGREAINPRPSEFAEIHNQFAPYTDGFISYTDGVHDDVNKIIWSMRAWDPQRDVRKILIDYSRFFFGPDVAVDAADAILALEKNWQGTLADNGAVDGTLQLWNQLEARAPELAGNWRWQMNVLRANYDAYVRRRLLYETELETRANAILAQAATMGARPAMDQALAVLNRTVTEPSSPELRQRIENLCQDLFDSIQLQTSVARYQASGAERGAILDFVDYPLNNRWWLEDRFREIAALPTEDARIEQLQLIATWENPGEGSYYDDIGNIAKSPHVLRWNPMTVNPGTVIYEPTPTYWWLDDGQSRARLSWLTTLSNNATVVYEGLDPKANYLIRVAGYGQSLLKADDERLTPSRDDRGFGEFKEFPVPPHLLEDRKLVVTWDRPTGEGRLNWRQQSRNAEIWLLKQ